jgi:hypothetical protein
MTRVLAGALVALAALGVAIYTTSPEGAARVMDGLLAVGIYVAIVAPMVIWWPTDD